MGLRKAKGADADVAAGFLSAMVHEMATYGGHSVAEEQRVSTWCHTHIGSRLSDTGCIVLLAESEEDPHTPLGFVEASLTEPHPVFETKQILHVHALYVEPCCRRQGIGRRLLKAALQWGRKHGCVEAQLNSLLGNPARQLYASMGFDVVELELRRSL